MSVAIRALKAGDAPAIAGIVDATELWQRHRLDGARAASLMQAALEAGDRVVVAEEDELLGFAWWMPRGAFARPYLRLIGVHPEARGKNIGAVLLEAFESDARKGFNSCFLLVSDFNTGAQRFYERHGYEKVGELPAFVLPDSSELIYRKVLKKL